MEKTNRKPTSYILIAMLSLIGVFSPLQVSGASNDSESDATGVLVRYHSQNLSGLSLNTINNDVTRLEVTADEEGVEDFVDRLNQDLDVAYAEADYVTRLDARPTDPFYDHLDTSETFYNYQMTQVIEVWDEVSLCDNVIIAVLDSGIDLDHPDLQDNLWFNANEIPDNGLDDDGNGYIDDWAGYDFYDNDNSIDDSFGHGSPVAGIIGAVGNNDIGLSGLCWSAQILPLKTFNDNGIGNVSSAIEAIHYAIDQGAHVINLSWSISSGQESRFLEEAIEDAAAAGIIVVAAAGNDGQNIDTDPIYPAAYQLPNLITVAAHNSSGQLSFFSNFGEENVDLAAPGVDILTTNHRGMYVRFSGTSAAAPHISATAALMLSLQPELSSSELVALLIGSAEDDESLHGLVASAGRLNVLNTLSALSEENSSDDADEQTLSPDPSESLPSFSGQGGCSLIRN